MELNFLQGLFQLKCTNTERELKQVSIKKTRGQDQNMFTLWLRGNTLSDGLPLLL